MDFIPNTSKDREAMLKSIGVSSVNDLFRDIPDSIKLKRALNLPKGMSELELRKHITALSYRNNIKLSFLGAGSYSHFIPSVVSHIVGRSEFYTAYTPYQPEISQGTLQAIYEFQSLICELTGMDVANASMYDGASALAESAMMATRISSRKEIIISSAVHPHYREVVRTYCSANGVKLIEVGFENGQTSLEELKKNISDNTAGVIVQNPNFFGSVEDLEAMDKIIHDNGAVFVVGVVEPTSLGLLAPPSEFNADIVVGEGQSFGNTINFGGPYVGFMATKEEHMRKLPGRLVGITEDVNGKKAFILTLQAREQHIRRDKATSNICTNSGLCALAATVHLVSIGTNLKEVAGQNVQKANYAFDRIKSLDNYKGVFSSPFYNEFVIKCTDSKKVNEGLIEKGIIGGLDLTPYYPGLENCMLFCVTENHTKEDIDQLVSMLDAIK